LQSLFAVLLIGLSACTSLPQQGPSTNAIIEQSESPNFLLINVDNDISRKLTTRAPNGFGSYFTKPPIKNANNIVGIGDILSVRIFEARNDALFASGAGKTDAAFPAIQVALDGSISLPFVGEIVVAGLSPRQIQEEIVKQLHNLVIEPQALVSLVRTNGNNVIITGDIIRPGKFRLSLTGDHLIDVVSQSGGSKFPAFETDVTVIRNGRKDSAKLSDIQGIPAQNIVLRSEDIIILSHEPKRFTINGAVNQSGTIPLTSPTLNVLEAIGLAGGLSDRRADRKGVFVFRYETRSLLHRLGYDELGKLGADPRGVPTIYRIDFSDVKSQFYAQSFRLLNRDGIYVANSDSVQLGKFLRLIGLGLGSFDAAIDLQDAIQ
jgi:polysaccharide export outer membrane protein